MQTLKPGEIIETHTISGFTSTYRHVGHVTKGKTIYGVQEKITTSEEFGTSSELLLSGPRGALYFLRNTNRPGVYLPHSVTGTHMKTQGNPAYLTVLGDVIEFNA